MQENRQLPQFIDINPCGKDLFESGSQKRTAESIVSHIKEGADTLKLIGLDGEYGSGKSNVISIIKSELKGTHHVFVYEAWSHQEDLQRRSFLEELTNDLEQHKLFKSGKWAEKLKSLLAKKKETKTITVPRLSPSIIISFFVVVLLPVAKVISDAATSEGTKLWIAGSPFILGLIVWLIGACIDREKFNLANLLYIYKDKDLQSTVNETIAEKEPSVTEFRKWMDELSRDLNKDAIIVFDNMDRLPPEKVQILWSLVHTFFSERHYKKITVIVPFDRNQIRQVFNKDAAEGQNQARHFIEKTFPVLFTVSPPVLTDWKGFFKAKYAEAFGDTENREYNLVKNIFDLYEEKITPRKIISFLNELVALKLTWKEQVPLRYAALFVLNKEQIAKDPLKEILDQGYLAKAKYLFKSDDGLADHIAALAYNIPVETAKQVTISRQILIWLRETNTSRLLEISEFSNFWEILDEVYSKEDIDIVPAAASLLELDRELNKENDNVIVSEIWDALAEKQIAAPVDDQVLAETHKILLEKASSPKMKKLVEHLLTQFRISRNFKGSTYYQALDELDAFVKEKKLNVILGPLLKDLSLAPEAFIDYVVVAKNKYADFKVRCDNAALDKYLTGKVSDGYLGTEVLLYIIDNYDFPLLLNEFETIISSTKLGSGDVEKLFTAYKVVSKGTNPLRVKLDDAAISSLFALSDVDTPGYYELSAMRLARSPDFAGTGAHTQAILTITETSLIEQVADRIEYYLSFGEILKQSVLFSTPLLRAVAKRLIENGAKGRKVDIAEILPLFDRIVDAVETTDQQLFAAFNKMSTTIKGVLNPDNIQTLLPGFRVYDAALAAKNELSSIVLETALRFIEDQDTDIYREWFADESSYGLQLLHFLLRTGSLLKMPNKALDAYKERLGDISRGTVEPPVSRPEIWREFYAHVDKRQIEGTIKNIRDAFLSDVTITAGKFLFFEELLRTQGDLPEKPGDVVRRLLTPVAREGLCSFRIIQHKGYYLGILAHAGNNLFDFVKEIRKMVEQDDTNASTNSFSADLNALLPGKITIRQAQYYADDQSEDVTDAIKHRVESDGQLHFKIGNDLVDNDPLPGVVKKLELEYDFDGNKVHAIIDEHKWLNVPFD